MNVIVLELARDQHLVGGKAINLARLLAAGFPVPGGFTVTTHAFRTAGGAVLSPEVRADIASAYAALGSPVVAVRSSATAEDLAGASMAGQYETILDVQGFDAVCVAIERCWASLRSPRVTAYLAQQRIDPAQVAMAVVVQRLVPSAVAGVLFTVNPRSGAADEMLIEASWGLGEAVVGALVQPDTVLVGRSDGVVRAATIADKQQALQPGSHQLQLVAEDLRRRACLTAVQIEELRQLGLRTEQAFGAPQDLEWAIADERLFLLQSRAITTLDALPQRLLAQEREELAAALARGEGPWVRHNLSETLPHPTPLTWSVIERFMSGTGGFGALYRQLGFDPAPGPILRRIAGRLYQDLARSPDLFWAGYPFRYDLAHLRLNPDAAQEPPSLPDGDAATHGIAQRRLMRIGAQITALAGDLAQQLEQRDIPAFRAWVGLEQARDLTALDAAGLRRCWEEREARVMGEFAPRSLLPSAVCADLQGRLQTLLAVWCWDEDPKQVADALSAGGRSSSTVLATAGLRRLAAGELDTAAWLAEHGHRGPGEFDLAAPRWHERPAAVAAYAAPLRTAEDPLALHERRSAAAADLLVTIERRMDASARRELHQLLDGLHGLLRFREDGKHELMRGYDLLRGLALECGRRLGIGDEVFLLTERELFQAVDTGYAPLALIARRRAQRQAEARLELPAVIAAEDLPGLGDPPAIPAGDRLEAFPIAGGRGSGPVRIVHSPEQAGDMGIGYVLVCPSTDPSWTPLFIHAAALVLERGGALSHGAVVARELGIPAVVVAGACQRLSAGEPLLVDGTQGIVLRGTGIDSVAHPEAHAAESRLLPLMPPPSGPGEARAGRWRNLAFLVWGLYLAAAFWPGDWSLDHVYRPSIAALDTVLWPLRSLLGGPWTVVVLSVVMATACLLLQRALTDNARLVVARDRAAGLRRTANRLLADDPQRQLFLTAAAPVQWRLLGAAMVPIAWLLGPMLMLVFWATDRIEARPSEPGTVMQVIAELDGEYTGGIQAVPVDGAHLVEHVTPAVQSLPPIRATLAELEGTWRKTSDLSALPWEVQAAARAAREATLADLSAFLARPLPPRELVWLVETPASAGRSAVELRADDGAILARVPFVTGAASPPVQTELVERPGQVARLLPVFRPPQGSVRRVTVIAQGQQLAPEPFWTPFAFLGWHWDPGWIFLYILSYVPCMLVLKRLLNVA